MGKIKIEFLPNKKTIYQSSQFIYDDGKTLKSCARNLFECDGGRTGNVD